MDRRSTRRAVLAPAFLCALEVPALVKVWLAGIALFGAEVLPVVTLEWPAPVREQSRHLRAVG